MFLLSLPEDVICHLYDTFDLDCLSRTRCVNQRCRALGSQSLTRRTRKILTPFSLPLSLTLHELDQVNGALGGSAAAKVVDPSAPDPRNLDFYVPTRYVQSFSQYLRSQGYHSAPTETGLHAIPQSDALRWISTLRRGACTIHLLQSQSMSPLPPLFFAPVTSAMNTVTSKGVTCYYPELTLCGKALSNIGPCQTRHLAFRESRVQQAKDAGLEVYSDCQDLHPETEHSDMNVKCRRNWRRTGEAPALTMSFNPDMPGVGMWPPVRWRLAASLGPRGEMEQEVQAEPTIEVDAEIDNVVYTNRADTLHLTM